MQEADNAAKNLITHPASLPGPPWEGCSTDSHSIKHTPGHSHSSGTGAIGRGCGGGGKGGRQPSWAAPTPGRPTGPRKKPTPPIEEAQERCGGGYRRRMENAAQTLCTARSGLGEGCRSAAKADTQTEQPSLGKLTAQPLCLHLENFHAVRS